MAEKRIERGARAHQPQVVGHVTRRLHGEGKVRRHGRCPSLIGRALMWLVERRVDLDCIESLRVAFEIAPSDIRVPSKQATVIALLVNELVSNAVFHGFRGRTSGRIAIQTEQRGGFAHVEVENDGERVPYDWRPSP